MSNRIGGYEPITPMRTVGSGSARWCLATRGLERYFLKQFLSPVYPVNPATALGQKQLARCEQFERRKQRLYAALSCVIGDTLVPVLDFFRFERRYYAVSEAASPLHISAGEADALTDELKRAVLYDLAVCLQRLHTQGVVHADLKPEHVLLMKRPGGYRVRLIDLDSGFLEDDPPAEDMEGDPVYLAPEAFLRLTGQDARLTCKVDTFALGAVIHRLWTGELPSFDAMRYTYLYEAALDGGEIRFGALPDTLMPVVRRMLHPDPMQRPEDAEVVSALAPDRERVWMPAEDMPMNGLSQFLKRG